MISDKPVQERIAEALGMIEVLGNHGIMLEGRELTFKFVALLPARIEAALKAAVDEAWRQHADCKGPRPKDWPQACLNAGVAELEKGQNDG